MRTDCSILEISEGDEEASREERFIYTSIGEACRRAKIDRAPVAIFFFFIFYGLQLFLAVAVGRPIPHTAHLRDCSTGSIGYSYEVRPTFRLLPWAISPTHCTTRSQLTIIDSIGQRRLRQYMPHCIRPRLRYYKRSYSFNPQSRFPDHSAESTGGLHRPNGILSRTSKTLTPWLQHRDRESNPGPTNGRRRSQDCATEPHL